MRLYNIIAQRQSQSRSLPCRFGGEEGLEDFVFDGGRDARAVVGEGDLNCVSEVFGEDGYHWL